MDEAMNTQTSSITVVPTQVALEGGGFQIRRAFPVAGLSYFDPILLIDEMGPVTYGPGEGIGAPDHPHRGFETVTYVLDGAMEHEDSHGHRGSLHPGDVQWMTAGAGVIHSEMPAKEIMEDGGRVHGFQIWVNLPKSLKLSTPRYQEYPSTSLPVVTGPGSWARVIAGELDGKKSPIETTVPTTMVHVKLDPHARLSIPLAAGSNAIVHTIDGEGRVSDTRLADHQAALIADAPAQLDLAAEGNGFEALVLAGRPLNEPVARYGPFVMNTREEIEQAFRDYQAGRFGEIARTN
jgi:redox-sensitive bicupin YhaK (pirin superfamily)